MLLTFDFSSDTPLYIQLRNQIIIGIADGRLISGEKLPTVRALAEESGINTMTVSKAYQLLKQEGYYDRPAQRRGCRAARGAGKRFGGNAVRAETEPFGAAPCGIWPRGDSGAVR